MLRKAYFEEASLVRRLLKVIVKVNLVLHERGTILKIEFDSRQKINEKTRGRGKEALNTF